MVRKLGYFFLLVILAGCNGKKQDVSEVIPPPASFSLNYLKVNGVRFLSDLKGVAIRPVVEVAFTSTLNQSSFPFSVALTDQNQVTTPLDLSLAGHDSILTIKPVSSLNYLSKYTLTISTALRSKGGGALLSPVNINMLTAMDSTFKFPVIPDDSLLTKIQRQTFRYFWEFGHPVSGLARERNSSGEVVTTGGTGFGILAILVGVERKFISRADGIARIQTILDFLSTKPPRFHGVFSHWMNGTTGAVVPFAPKDNGADLVETSYLVMGLLTARQYFNGNSADEVRLRKDINALWNSVEWDWYQKDGGNVLFWNWSPDYDFAVNVPVSGWNECLITYVLASASATHPISKPVYDTGFARNGAMQNNQSYYGYQLPLGPAFGGPLFFEEYSFLGLNPNGLSDAWANYQQQTINHTKINYSYCQANPKQYYGYSNQCWGLTASDVPGGYSAGSPTNDSGVIAPTAAVSALPYAPEESLRAIRFFYYQLGDKVWGDYGFKDAFSLDTSWFAGSYLAIDQGPQIGMIENYRTGMLWKLFMSCPEVQAGLTKLGFSYKTN
jgi:hypothetical protein